MSTPGPATVETPASNTTLATIIVRPARMALGLGEKLLADVPAALFATSPHPTLNHPAFIVGHLAVYGDRMLEMLGRDDLMRPRPELFDRYRMGAECLHDPAHYLSRDDAVAWYVDRYTAAIDALAEASDDILQHPNPIEGRFRVALPTVGDTLNFLLVAHHMMHLGQISAWRRTVGLPSVM